MSVRWKAWLMLLVVGLVLPAAGAPLRFCMQSRVAVDVGNSCSGCIAETDCCCHQSGEGPQAPGCVGALKLLPDATSQGDFVLPAPVVIDLLPWAMPVPMGMPVIGLAESRARERGPPSAMPLYLRLALLLL